MTRSVACHRSIDQVRIVQHVGIIQARNARKTLIVLIVTISRCMFALARLDLSRVMIGQPLDRPQQMFLLTHLAPDAIPSDVERAAHAIVSEELANLPAFCRALAAGERQVP